MEQAAALHLAAQAGAVATEDEHPAAREPVAAKELTPRGKVGPGGHRRSASFGRRESGQRARDGGYRRSGSFGRRDSTRAAVIVATVDGLSYRR